VAPVLESILLDNKRLGFIIMLNRFHSISSKVLVIFLAFLALSIGVLTVLAYQSSSKVLDAQASKSMESILVFRGDMLRERLEQLQTQADSIARIESLQMGAVSMRSGWGTVQKNSGDAKAELQRVFVTQNPYGANEREKLIKPENPSGFYYSTHEKTQTDMAVFLQGTPFSDVLFADPTGTIYYSFRKGPAFGENVSSGTWAQGGLGAAFAQAAENAKKAANDVAATSFSGLTIDAATNESGIYFGIPIVKFEAFKGVILFRVREDVFTQILAKGITAGSSEKPAIISADGKAIGLEGNKLVSLDAAPYAFHQAALATDAMTVAAIDRPDGEANAYARPFSFAGTKYLAVESILRSELNAGSISIAGTLALIGLCVLVVIGAATALFARRMFAPLTKLAGLTGDVAAGNLDAEIGNQDRKDEIGKMAQALGSFREKLIRQRELEASSDRTRQEAEETRRAHLAEREAEAATLQMVVRSLDDGLERLANGNLAHRIDAPFPDELESLRGNFNQALATLSETMHAIGGNSAAVRSGSEEMRVGADQLAERTERQAASITQTASAINTITEEVRHQIARAEQARKIAQDANMETVASGKVMSQTIAAMEAIQNSSIQINQIISVIDEIAFQTNLLALNAGVEAARAGDAGKGFAVVAQEVRQLAQRSAAAAKEISSLLKRSTDEVSTGVSLVEKAGHSLTGIGAHVQTINERIQEIMESTREEANTLIEINSAVSGLDAMTQQNAAMVEETTAAIHNLASEAGEMDGRLGQFVLDNVDTAKGWAQPSHLRRAG
jgi:methyl-accepting chemotaxis protein